MMQTESIRLKAQLVSNLYSR